AAREAALRFFSAPASRKLAAVTNEHHHGYLGPGATRMHDDAAVDLKESFNFGMELEPGVVPNPLLGPNVWPAG
ncbi:MAG: 2OG-Fe(II) oxygenase, partial [Actinobacteria bacterium]|nr:2OG-Fe(II) oxygenase [Actinomycetota bacterium]NIS29174.1 2OG-Fe(II) oxygenase [Actinomycetota bacterium]NIU20342.1 2OG-Fe(II) oxygenase [Actinomycetota bacterium]NIU64577.1 2OG-Fe(II) oxygenase [Actinomycetota bacterium]NIV56819.1 2OG-Fe(II) oxygenase [Actinomycetota bacterium]